MAVITNARLDALRTTVDLKFAQAFEGTPTWFDKLCTDVPSDSDTVVYGFKAQSTSLEEWLGPRTLSNLLEHEYELKNKLYQAAVELPRIKVEDDKLGVFYAMTIPDLAEATRKHPDRLLADLLTANPTGYDGKAFFADDHPNYNATGAGATTFDNDVAAAITGDGIAGVWEAMTSRIGENGRPLTVNPRLWVVPPQQYREALTIAQSTTYAIPKTATTTAATVDNVLKGWFDVLMVPELATAPTISYLMDVSRPIRPFVHQLRDAPQLVSRINLEDPKVFDLDTFTWGVRVRRNMGVTLPHLITRITRA